jgi:hypothetical protein
MIHPSAASSTNLEIEVYRIMHVNHSPIVSAGSDFHDRDLAGSSPFVFVNSSVQAQSN